MLDAALLRPGRLDRLLYCGFPTARERLQVRWQPRPYAAWAGTHVDETGGVPYLQHTHHAHRAQHRDSGQPSQVPSQGLISQTACSQKRWALSGLSASRGRAAFGEQCLLRSQCVMVSAECSLYRHRLCDLQIPHLLRHSHTALGSLVTFHSGWFGCCCERVFLTATLNTRSTEHAVRLQVLKALTSRLALDAGVSLQEVAGACEGFSGADLSALLADAQLEAVHEVLSDPGGADKVRQCAHASQERPIGILQHSSPFHVLHLTLRASRALAFAPAPPCLF